jgi:hypothetical protein
MESEATLFAAHVTIAGLALLYEISIHSAVKRLWRGMHVATVFQTPPDAREEVGKANEAQVRLIQDDIVFAIKTLGVRHLLIATSILCFARDSTGGRVCGGVSAAALLLVWMCFPAEPSEFFKRGPIPGVTWLSWAHAAVGLVVVMNVVPAIIL